MLTCTREKKLKINTRPVGKFVWGQASRESDPLTEVCCCLTDDRSQVWFLLTTVHVSSDGPLLPDAANRRKQTQWRLSRQRSACFVRLWQRQLQGRAGGKEQINLTHSRWAGVVGWGWCSQFPVSLTCWSSLTLPLKVFQAWLCGCDLDSTRPTQQTCESHQLLSVSPTATRLRLKGRNHQADGYSSPQSPHINSLLFTQCSRFLTALMTTH